MEFKKIDFWGQTPDELIAEAKAKAEPLFDTEKTVIANYRIAATERIKKLEELQALPKPNEHIRIITHNSFNAFSWIDFLCDKYPVFSQAYITSYNYAEAPITLLLDKFDSGQFEKLSLVISESIRFRMPKRFFQLKDGVQKRNNPNLRCAGVWNHSKIICLQPKGTGDFFVIEGSGNFSENAYIEQYSVDNSKQLFEFHQNWIEKYIFDPGNIDKKRHFII